MPLSLSNSQELQVLEAIQCPACNTQYGLRRERVLPRHARARCFRCQGEFPIKAEVASLLGLPAQEAMPDATATMGFRVEEIKQAHSTGATLEPSDLLIGDDDILEKTLVSEPVASPEDRYTTGPVPELPPDERTASGTDEAASSSDGRVTGSYKSAKDAISHLFADTPAPAGPRLVRQSTEKTSMELEATLEALENTLGGTPLAEAAEAHEAPAAAHHAEAPLHAEDLPQTSGATQRMSLAELQAAIASAKGPEPEVEPTPAPHASEPAQELDAMEVTQMVDSSRIARQQPNPAATHPLGPLAGGEPMSDDPNLLRLKIGDDVYPNLAMDQLIRWVEEGRVVETHLVARQFSENWIEAHKVPGLRPVFERLKRLQAGAPMLDPMGTAPVKKSLFGGLFGKKD